MGADYDIILGYLVLPIGWAGGPGVFASISEIITRYRMLSPPANEFRGGDRPFRSHVFVDDGIAISNLIWPTDWNRVRLLGKGVVI